MNKEEKYLRDLMRELPREKAPEGITELIMQKIEPKREWVKFPKVVFWDTLAFWIFLAIAVTEGWLFWSSKSYITVDSARAVYRLIVQRGYEYLTAFDSVTVLGYGIAVALGVYFLVKQSLSERKYRLSI